MPYFKVNVNPLTGIKNNINYTFKSKNSLPKMVVRHRFINSHPTTTLSLRNFSIEYGLNLHPKSTWLTPKLLIAIISSVMALTLIWWLNNSNASMSPMPDKFTPVSTTNLIAVPLELPIEIPIKLPTIPIPSIEIPTVAKLPWLHIQVQTGNTLSTIFKEHNLNQVHQINQTEHAQQLRQLKINQELHIKHDGNGNVQNLILILNKTDELHVFRIRDKEFESEIRPIGKSTETVSVHGIIKTTLSAAAQQAGLSTQQLKRLMNIFVYNIDFERDIKVGDQFSVVYKQHQFGKDIEEGNILVAEFINSGKVYQALRYTDQNGNTDYYAPTGDNLQQISLLTVPITNFKRISSKFGERKHPISRRKHLHTGIDYSAERGTPIIAAGDAVVKFLGRKSGYGKVIVLEHNARVQTLYAHMLKFVKNLKVGDEVSQGEFIGYVGRTGRTTGPHLHYEVLIDDEYKNPLDFKTPFSLPIAETKYPHFVMKTKKLLAQLNAINKSLLPTKLVQSVPITHKSLLQQHVADI